MPGVRCTRGSGKKMPGVVHRFTGLNRHSLRNGFTVASCSPWRTGLSCHHRSKEAFASQELDANLWGVRTTRLGRTLRRRSSTPKRGDAIASTAACPNVSDEGLRPLLRDRMGTLSR
jgi:hypothetical protein